MHRDHALYYNDLAAFLVHLNRIDDAIDYAELAIRYDPSKPSYSLTLGALFLKKREQIEKDKNLKDQPKKELMFHWTKKANETFHEVIKQDKNSAEGWFYYSMSLYYLGEIKEANKAVLEAIQIDNENASYFDQLGVTYLALKNKADAIAAFRKATLLEPKNKRFQTGLKKAQEMEVKKKGGR
jgi:tetratricopeptide (TPR) repeat protein